MTEPDTGWQETVRVLAFTPDGSPLNLIFHARRVTSIRTWGEGGITKARVHFVDGVEFDRDQPGRAGVPVRAAHLFGVQTLTVGPYEGEVGGR